MTDALNVLGNRIFVFPMGMEIRRLSLATTSRFAIAAIKVFFCEFHA
ncbi:MAG: hypothetical protein VZR28_06525 [Candidatus Cryptobacteroides sp.]|nr:hypothetical protein [Candidatus Cryptobacteroides sp.]